MNYSKSDIKKWCKALRSGKYSQTTRCLQDEKGYCCFGVGCEILIPANLRIYKYPNFLFGRMVADQPHAPKWFKRIEDDFFAKTGFSLMDLNDAHDFTFDEIADLVELVYIHEAL